MWAAAGDDDALNVVEPKVLSETSPAGGVLQWKLVLTEPKPILKGRQQLAFSSTLFGKPLGIHLFSPAGDASGVAVVAEGRVRIYFNSPLTSLGTQESFPLLTMALPIRESATTGQQQELRLDPEGSTWINSSEQPYETELKSGVLTIGNSMSISDVSPGSGIVPAGTRIAIRGTGFQPGSIVKVRDARVASSKHINSRLIEVTLTTDLEMEGRRVRVVNPATNEVATYYSYQRTVATGSSKHPLLAAAYPLFARSQRRVAYFLPVFSGRVFSGLALQNTSPAATAVSVELYSRQGNLLDCQLVILPPNSRLTRDLREIFSSVPAIGTAVKVVSGVPIQVLGMVGDEDSGIVLPVDPAPAL